MTGKAIIIFLFILFPFIGKTQSKGELEKYIQNFLSNQISGSDSLFPTREGYSFNILKEDFIHRKKISIYLFERNISDSKSYLLIIDRRTNKWDVYGQNDLTTDILSLKSFFDKEPQIKKTTVLLCYNYLIDNYYQPYGKWEKLPIKGK